MATRTITTGVEPATFEEYALKRMVQTHYDIKDPHYQYHLHTLDHYYLQPTNIEEDMVPAVVFVSAMNSETAPIIQEIHDKADKHLKKVFPIYMFMRRPTLKHSKFTVDKDNPSLLHYKEDYTIQLSVVGLKLVLVFRYKDETPLLTWCCTVEELEEYASLKSFANHVEDVVSMISEYHHSFLSCERNYKFKMIDDHLCIHFPSLGSPNLYIALDGISPIRTQVTRITHISYNAICEAAERFHSTLPEDQKHFITGLKIDAGKNFYYLFDEEMTTKRYIEFSYTHRLYTNNNSAEGLEPVIRYEYRLWRYPFQANKEKLNKYLEKHHPYFMSLLPFSKTCQLKTTSTDRQVDFIIELDTCNVVLRLNRSELNDDGLDQIQSNTKPIRFTYED